MNKKRDQIDSNHLIIRRLNPCKIVTIIISVLFSFWKISAQYLSSLVQSSSFNQFSFNSLMASLEIQLELLLCSLFFYFCFISSHLPFAIRMHNNLVGNFRRNKNDEWKQRTKLYGWHMYVLISCSTTEINQIEFYVLIEHTVFRSQSQYMHIVTTAPLYF